MPLIPGTNSLCQKSQYNVGCFFFEKHPKKKIQKDLNNNLPHLGYRLNSRGSKANSKQAPMHWLREITKAKLSQANFG